MIGLVLVIMFLLISGWNSIIEPMVVNGQSFQNMFVNLRIVCSWSVQQMGINNVLFQLRLNSLMIN